ncbi:hypothetical protein D8782_03805 [Streptococcus sp. A12]|nr:hypothetical protein D8782_03805 [Streptococcus sp. A12]
MKEKNIIEELVILVFYIICMRRKSFIQTHLLLFVSI